MTTPAAPAVEPGEQMFEVANQPRRRTIVTRMSGHFTRERNARVGGRVPARVCCAHVSDVTVTRLQAGRIARQASEGDDVTIDCVSIEEAERALRERRLELLAPAR
jgi:hypothetical protein